jgi:phosphoribosylaminoimidazole-succinocarboxamide synthase
MPDRAMLDEAFFAAHLGDALAGVDLAGLGPRTRGKVRDIYTHGDRLILITTDRLSAFDRILGLVPFKGQVLNQLAASGSSRRARSCPTTCWPCPTRT